MSCVGAAWIEPLSVSALGKRTQSGAGKSMIPLTRQTLPSTPGYLIISVATCSLMTPITYLAPQVRHVLRQIKCTSWQSRTQGHRTYRGREVRMKEGPQPQWNHLRIYMLIQSSAAPLHAVLFLDLSPQRSMCRWNIYFYFSSWRPASHISTLLRSYTFANQRFKNHTRISNNTHLYNAKVYHQVVYDIEGSQQWIILYNVL